MPNTINIVQPKAEDGVTEVSFVTRTNSIYKSDGSHLGDSLDAYMDEVDELSQNLAVLNGMGYKLKKGESITLSAQSIAAGNGAGNKAESILTNVELADDVTSVSGVFTASNLYNYAGTAVTVTSTTALKYGKNVAISQTANIGSHVMGAASFAVTLTAS